MAVLLPVLLFAGLAQKLFVPLAITVAVAMAASFFVSVDGHAGRVSLPARPRASPAGSRSAFERGSRGSRPATRASLDRVLDAGWVVVVGSFVLVVASGWVATRLPSLFFPEIDESMERIYVRLAPGTSIEDSSKKMQEMGEDLRKQLPGIDMVLTNVGSPKAARSAMNSPNWGPHMGFIRLGLTDPEERSDSQREIADKARAILVHDYPGVDFLQWPGGLVASVFSNGYSAPLVVEVRGDSLEQLDAQSRAVAESRAPSAACATCGRRSRSTIPRSTSTPIARRPARSASPRARRRRRRSTRRSATSTRRRVGRRRQRRVLLRRHRVRRQARSTTPPRCAPCRCGSARTARPSRSARTARSGARPARSRSSATSCSARRTC